jgi:hypothetical protein
MLVSSINSCPMVHKAVETRIVAGLVMPCMGLHAPFWSRSE